jgi:hypothetical protein
MRIADGPMPTPRRPAPRSMGTPTMWMRLSDLVVVVAFFIG